MSRMPSANNVSSSDQLSGVSRRHVLGGVAAVGTVGLSGCSNLIDWIFDQVIEDVNIVNATREPRSGTIVLTDPDEETVLEDSFDLPEAEEDDDGELEAEFLEEGIFEDVWTTDGEYEASVELAEGDEIDDVESANVTVTVADTDDDHLFIYLTDSDDDDAIQFEVAASITDLDDFGEEINEE